MARNYNEIGPPMPYWNGAYSGEVLFRRTSSQNGVKRTRPKDLMRNPTSLYATQVRINYVYCILPAYDKDHPQPMQRLSSVTAGNDPRVVACESDAKRSAAAKLRDRLKNQEWNAATSFGELNKTLEFIADAARDLLHAYRLARRGDILGLADFYQRYDYRGRRRRPPYVRVSNRWLQYRYAVRPLVFDLQDMYNEFLHSDMSPAVRRVTGTGKSQDLGIIDKGVSAKIPFWAQREAAFSGRYVSFVEVDPDIETWKRLGLLNFPALLWELTPGSFLLDWVLPVGDYLNGLDAAIGVTNVATTYSVKTDQNEEFHYNGAVQTASRKTYYRTVEGIPSQPLPRFRVIDKDISAKFLDVAALVTQALTGRLGRR